MVKAVLLEIQSPGWKPTGVRKLIEAHAEVRDRGFCLRLLYSLIASRQGRRLDKETNGNLTRSMVQNVSETGIT
jgi:hypothetical protein